MSLQYVTGSSGVTLTDFRIRRAFVLIAAGLLVVSIGGCSSSDSGGNGDTEPDGTEKLSIDSLSVIENPSNSLSRYVEWETSPASEGMLAVDCGDGAYTSSFETDMASSREVFVMGFWRGAECQVEVTASREGESVTQTDSFTVDSLPDYLPELTAEVSKPDQMQPGWTIVNLNNSFDNVPLIVAMVDAQGRYRWYHQRDTSGSGAATAISPVEKGLLVGGTFDTGRIWPALIGWDGDLVWEAELDMHHDIRPWKGSSILYLSEANGCPDTMPNSSNIIRYDRETNTEEWRWAFCKHYTPDKPDWEHTNTIEPFPNQDAILTSARDWSSLFKVKPPDGGVVWRLGEGGDFDRTDDPGTPAFLRQHAPEIQPNGNILLFDNGSNSRPYSRAVEISYDTNEMTMEVVWKYRPDPDIFARIWSDANRLDNGNTLVAFGRRQENNNSIIHEVTSNKEVVWDLRSPDSWGWYRAHRISDPPKGMIE